MLADKTLMRDAVIILLSAKKTASFIENLVFDIYSNFMLQKLGMRADAYERNIL